MFSRLSFLFAMVPRDVHVFAKEKGFKVMSNRYVYIHVVYGIISVFFGYFFGCVKRGLIVK